MIKQLAKLERRYLEIESLLSKSEIVANANEFRRLSKERAEAEEPVILFRQYQQYQKEVVEVNNIIAESKGEMAEFAEAELADLTTKIAELEEQLKLACLPKDPFDGKNVFLEIRAGAGGDEASLFVAKLFRMYQRFSEKMRWKMELISLSENELGGMKEVVALIEGSNVYRTLKFESGVHRVQRVPVTEAQGRIHTSTVTVAVLPEAEDVEVNINENDLRIDTFRASGAGGQHVNRTDSAVRITHLPSGIVVSCQDERSQIKNKSKAMKVLQAKLLEIAEMEREKAQASDRKTQVGRGDRSERIRTYNFPQSRVTDHRINFTTHAIDAFLEGEIAEMVEKLKSHYQALALSEQSSAE